MKKGYHFLPEQRLKAEIAWRNQCLGRKAWDVIAKLEAQCGQVWELKTSCWQSPSLGETSKPEPNWHRRGGKSPTSAHCSHPISPKEEEENWETLVVFTVQRHRLAKRQRPNHRTIECFPSPNSSPSIISLKAYLQQLLLPRTSRLAVKEELQGIPKGKKHN